MKLASLCLYSSLSLLNSIEIPVTAKTYESEKKFHKTIDQLENSFSGEINAYGAELRVVRDWENSELNAQAFRSGKEFFIKLYGGLFRYETITPDAYRLIICHELGHLIGGAPTFKPRNDGSSEGQADYFSTAKCFRKLIRGEDHSRGIERKPIHPMALGKCEESFPLKSEDYQICLRTSLATESLARTFKSLGELDTLPQLDTPDPYIRTFTLFNGYPNAQCRVDTLFAGSLCTKAESELNDFDLQNYHQGNCNQDEGYSEGVRPACWYVSRSDP